MLLTLNWTWEQLLQINALVLVGHCYSEISMWANSNATPYISINIRVALSLSLISSAKNLFSYDLVRLVISFLVHGVAFDISVLSGLLQVWGTDSKVPEGTWDAS